MPDGTPIGIGPRTCIPLIQGFSPGLERCADNARSDCTTHRRDAEVIGFLPGNVSMPRCDFSSGSRPASTNSSQRGRLTSDCVAKHDAEQRARNNRIRLNGGLNQCCAQVFVLESILLISVVKIVLQHIPSISGNLRQPQPTILRFRPSRAAAAEVV